MDTNWYGHVRDDGYSVKQVLHGLELDWQILSPFGGVALDTCPCCNNYMPSANIAMKVCDAIYPMKGKAA